MKEKLQRQLQREAAQIIDQLQREGYDIIIPIEETVPEDLYPAFITGVENWGEQLLLPLDIRLRLVEECTGKVHVKIYDTGDKLSHPDLQEGQSQGRNYSGGQYGIDIHGHSTHVAGICFAKGFGMLYDLVAGGLISWEPVKFLNDSGGASYQTVAKGVQEEKAFNHAYLSKGIPVVINCSFGGGTTPYGPLEDAFKESIAAGVTYIFSAGNTGKDVNYPALSPSVFAISSLDQGLTISSFSSRGPEVFVCAPGRSIVSTYKNDSYASLSGTSMAAPFVTALVAIAHSRWPGKLKSRRDIEQYFRAIATDLKPEGRDDLYGYGLAYVRAILDNDPGDPTTPPPDPEPEPEPEPDPRPIVKPMRTFTFELPDTYVMPWRSKNDPASRFLYFTMTVEIRDKAMAADIYDRVKQYSDAFLKRSSLQLTPNSDYDDATFWTAYFYRLILRKDIDVMPVQIIARDEIGRTTTLSGERLSRIRGLKSLFLSDRKVMETMNAKIISQLKK